MTGTGLFAPAGPTSSGPISSGHPLGVVKVPWQPPWPLKMTASEEFPHGGMHYSQPARLSMPFAELPGQFMPHIQSMVSPGRATSPTMWTNTTTISQAPPALEFSQRCRSWSPPPPSLCAASVSMPAAWDSRPAPQQIVATVVARPTGVAASKAPGAASLSGLAAAARNAGLTAIAGSHAAPRRVLSGTLSSVGSSAFEGEPLTPGPAPIIGPVARVAPPPGEKANYSPIGSLSSAVPKLQQPGTSPSPPSAVSTAASSSVLPRTPDYVPESESVMAPSPITRRRFPTPREDQIDNALKHWPDTSGPFEKASETLPAPKSDSFSAGVAGIQSDAEKVCLQEPRGTPRPQDLQIGRRSVTQRQVARFTNPRVAQVRPPALRRPIECTMVLHDLSDQELWDVAEKRLAIDVAPRLLRRLTRTEILSLLEAQQELPDGFGSAPHPSTSCSRNTRGPAGGSATRASSVEHPSSKTALRSRSADIDHANRHRTERAPRARGSCEESNNTSHRRSQRSSVQGPLGNYVSGSPPPPSTPQASSVPSHSRCRSTSCSTRRAGSSTEELRQRRWRN